jgi:hypothetical protein
MRSPYVILDDVPGVDAFVELLPLELGAASSRPVEDDDR